ncbi:MAG: hypothetical protein AMJ81_00450 [Phycisphaerae bacterium SM23_33]|nr:MAG: hypothetical protein AMJ81_00450 [Phycisphaerae bacterium SM23_33]
MMNRTQGGVLKKDTVRMAEGHGLIGGPAGQPGQASGPAARIVEQGQTGVLIEVTCVCGRKTQLQCDYAPAPAPAPA